MTIAPVASGRLIDLAPELSSRYQDYFTAVLDGGSLDAQCRAAVALGAALALGKQDTVRSFLAAAKQVGLENEALGHVAAIVDVVRSEVHARALDATAHQHQHQPKASKSCC